MRAELLKLCKLKKIQQTLPQLPEECFTYKYCRNIQLKLNSQRENNKIEKVILKKYDKLNFNILQKFEYSYVCCEIQAGKLKFNFHDYMYSQPHKLAHYVFRCNRYNIDIDLEFKNKKLNKVIVDGCSMSIAELKKMKYLLSHPELMAFE